MAIKETLIYLGYRFAPDVVTYIEDLLAERGITVSYETIRQWRAIWGRALVDAGRSTMTEPSASSADTTSLSLAYGESRGIGFMAIALLQMT